MKKLLTLLAVAGMMSFYACGPSEEDKAAADKAAQDSMAAAEASMQAAQEAAMAAPAPDSMPPAADSAAVAH